MNLLAKTQNNIAIEWMGGTITYAELIVEIETRKQWLRTIGKQRIALLMDNSPEWVMFDLACQQLEVTLVPVPMFFSDSQLQHLLVEAEIELLISDKPRGLNNGTQIKCRYSGVLAYLLQNAGIPKIPNGTSKITFTSGSTGNPKGVCLSAESQHIVCHSLVERIALDKPRHLCLLPLPLLLENIAGIYAPLAAGGTVILASEAERGFKGSRLIHPEALLKIIDDSEPDTLILVPELLLTLIGATKRGWRPPLTLKFIAVGGAYVAVELLITARAVGLPVYQGYGLSECVSVTTLNVPDDDEVESVGRCLPHNTLHVRDDEIMAEGNLFLGYLNEPESFYPKEVGTGDLGSEKQGRFFVQGRKSNLMVNSFGRNISPEWVESLLMSSGLFKQCMVTGDGQPYCVALIVPVLLSTSETEVAHFIHHINTLLPDYASIHNWLIVDPFSEAQGTLTSTGKIRRQYIYAHYEQQILSLYTKQAI